MSEKYILALCVALSLLVHSHFTLDGFGEPDAGFLAYDAVLSHHDGMSRAYPLVDYRIWSSPLYIHYLKKSLDWGLPISGLPSLMNWSNIVVGSLILIPLYLLGKRLIGSEAAAVGCVLYSLTPAYWLANIYGMPHLPAFGFLVTALLLFLHSLESQGGKFQGSIILAAACMIAAGSLKADILLCGGAFLGVLISQRKWNIRNIAWAVIIVSIGVGAVITYTSILNVSKVSVANFASNWNERFPFTLEAILNKHNDRAIVLTGGPILFLAILSALLYGTLMRKEHRRFVAMALMWSLPTLLFWGLKFSNSARHNMAVFFPLVLLVGLFLCSNITPGRWRYVALAVLLITNYGSTSGRDSVNFPSSRIFESSLDLQHKISKLHDAGKKFAALEGDKKLWLGFDSNPYVFFEVIANAKSYEFSGPGIKVVTKEDKIQLIALKYDANQESALKYAETWRDRDGWVVSSAEYDLRKFPQSSN